MKKIRSQIIQNNSKITIPILLLSLALVFTFGTHAVSAAPGDTIYVNGSSGNDSWDGQSSVYNGTTGSGPKLSIKNATGTVNENGTVNIANGIYSGVNNTNVSINKNMAIRGQSQTGTIIDAQSSGRMFTVDSGVTVLIQNLTFINGSITGDGGAIHNSGNLTVSNCIFTNNSIEGPNVGGGAIYNNGNLTVNNSIFTNDTSQIYGGAICNDGGANLVVNNSIFLDNMAFIGGAIENFGNSTTNNSIFINNTGNWAGGAIFSQGIATITANTFLYNKVNPVYGRGGAVFNNGNDGSVTLHFNRIIGNDLGEVAGTLTNATLNWWGSNSDPSSLVEDSVTINPWLVLSVDANPTIIPNGANSSVIADLLHDNTGTYHDPASGHVPDGIQIDLTVPWGSFTNSVITHSITLNTVNGSVKSIFYANDGTTPSPNPVPVRATADGYITNDTESAYITIRNAVADVQLIKTASNIKPKVGQMFTFTVTARNNGPDTATGVQITDLIPDGLVFNGYTSSQGTYDPETGIWMVGTILNGSNAVLNLFVTPTLMVAATKVTNTAVLTAVDQYDPTDDIASASVYVQPVVIVIQKISIISMYSITGYDVSCSDPTVKAANKTTEMDPTGIPLAGFIAAVLMVISGLIIPRKR